MKKIIKILEMKGSKNSAESLIHSLDQVEDTQYQVRKGS
jgi:hypothetical protein